MSWAPFVRISPSMKGVPNPLVERVDHFGPSCDSIFTRPVDASVVDRDVDEWPVDFAKPITANRTEIMIGVTNFICLPAHYCIFLHMPRYSWYLNTNCSLATFTTTVKGAFLGLA